MLESNSDPKAEIMVGSAQIQVFKAWLNGEV